MPENIDKEPEVPEVEQPKPAEEVPTPNPTKQSNTDLDLDDLVASGKRIRFGGKIISIDQPTVEQVFTIQHYFAKIEELQRVKHDPDDVEAAKQKGKDLEEATRELLDILRSLAPELKDADLNATQMVALTALVLGMTETQQQKRMREKGITMVDDSPKDQAQSTSK